MPRQPQPLSPAEANLAARLAAELGEGDAVALRALRRLARHCEEDEAEAWLAEARARHHVGQLTRRDGGARTLGGAFFQLVKAALAGDPARLRAVFPKAKGSGRGWAEQLPPGVAWAERAGLLTATYPGGKASRVKITLVGRPEGAVERREYTVLRLVHRGPLPALPKGLPLPPQPPETVYTVYIAAKQWRRVATALKQPGDQLIVEGIPIYDAEIGTMAVFASSVTTRELQRAARSGGA